MRILSHSLALASTLLWCGAANLAQAAERSPYDPSHAKAPPRVASATIELLDKPVAAGNVLLRVRFAEDRRSKPVVINGGPGPTTLRDDGIAPDAKAGDGLHTAIVNVNTQQYYKEQTRRVELARSGVKTVPQFRLRELLREPVPFQPSPAVTLRPGIAHTLDKYWGVPYGVHRERELMITHTLVVEDPMRTYEPCTGVGTQMGPWTFGRLMTEMANQPVTGMDPSDFVEEWMSQWKTDQTINGFTAWDRPGTQAFLDQWPRLPNGKLDLGRAPFRLLAIVNRLDLRGNTAYGSGDAGEARLVFGALNCGGWKPPPGLGMPEVLPYTVIFEYGIDKGHCFAVRDWAQQWHALGGLVPGSAAYNAALQAITDQFTLKNADPSQLPNRSAINQVRTNEIPLLGALGDSFWELRESKLDPATGRLVHRTIAQTPAMSKQFSAALRDYINHHELAILNGVHQVPLDYPAGSPFLGPLAQSGTSGPWNATGIFNLEARHKFSMATCDGCHEKENVTANIRFLHIKPRQIGAQSVLSNFLTGAGMPVNDPVSGLPHTFHDLLDRAEKLDLTANMSCAFKTDFPLEELFFEPLVPAFAH